MNGLKILGIILIVAGAIALAYKGFSYNKKHELLDGVLTVKTRERVNVPIWVGFVLVGGGIALVAAGGRKK